MLGNYRGKTDGCEYKSIVGLAGSNDENREEHLAWTEAATINGEGVVISRKEDWVSSHGCYSLRMRQLLSWLTTSNGTKPYEGRNGLAYNTR